MSVPPANKPADFHSMKKHTMPDAHALCGMSRFSRVFSLANIGCEVRP
jgi:hypothetical protein